MSSAENAQRVVKVKLDCLKKLLRRSWNIPSNDKMTKMQKELVRLHCSIFFKYLHWQAWANGADPDHMLQNSASDHGLQQFLDASTDSKMEHLQILTLKAPITTAADDILKYFFLFFKENKSSHFMWIILIFQRKQVLTFHVNHLLGLTWMFSLKKKMF